MNLTFRLTANSPDTKPFEQADALANEARKIFFDDATKFASAISRLPEDFKTACFEAGADIQFCGRHFEGSAPSILVLLSDYTARESQVYAPEFFGRLCNLLGISKESRRVSYGYLRGDVEIQTSTGPIELQIHVALTDTCDLRYETTTETVEKSTLVVDPACLAVAGVQ